MDFREFLSKNIVILDGGMGTLLQGAGLLSSELPERWNITHPDIIEGIHRDYFKAGSSVVLANTFGANLLKFDEGELKEIIAAALECAKRARDGMESDGERFVALDIGPLGRLIKPLGDLDFEDAVEIFAKSVRIGTELGCDLIVIETVNDSYETKAALLAAKENSTLPVIVTNAYGSDGKLMTGASPSAMVALLEGMGADAVGANCSLGARELMPVIRELVEYASVPVVLKPNAGLPEPVSGKTVYNVTPSEFSEDIIEAISLGVRCVGGCCGTTPEYIRALSEKISEIKPKPTEKKNITLVSSYTHSVRLGDAPVLIGERINPTGKKRFKTALIQKDIGYILSEAAAEEEAGAHILDVNVGLPETDEKEMLVRCIGEIQAVTALPLQIDTSNYVAMEAAMRRYNGKAMINSVNGKAESMAAVFSLVKKYGGVAVALTLDERGIPETADGRVEIARKILAEAEKYGIDKKDIIFDPLAMAVSADVNSANVTLCAIERITKELSANTLLGVSNISFGLPRRDMLNGTFFTMALMRGLSAAIINPHSAEMQKAYYAYRALIGQDQGFADYIEHAEGFVSSEAIKVRVPERSGEEYPSALVRAIVKGFRDTAAKVCREMLSSTPPIDIVNNEIIPALDIVGAGYEEKRIYLPALLMSAEAAKAAFEEIKCHAFAGEVSVKREKVVLATVEGDIHDIGKNIVKLILENYGYDVIDLGRDVSPERVVAAVISHNARICGLSALMTTTLPAMEKTVAELKKSAPDCKVIVGGAVLTEEYARKLGADGYARDAMSTVRYAEIFGK